MMIAHVFDTSGRRTRARTAEGGVRSGGSHGSVCPVPTRTSTRRDRGGARRCTVARPRGRESHPRRRAGAHRDRERLPTDRPRQQRLHRAARWRGQVARPEARRGPGMRECHEGAPRLRQQRVLHRVRGRRGPAEERLRQQGRRGVPHHSNIRRRARPDRQLDPHHPGRRYLPLRQHGRPQRRESAARSRAPVLARRPQLRERPARARAHPGRGL